MMLVIIKDNNIINNYLLDKDINYKGISIYRKNSKFYIDLKSGLYFDDNSKSRVLQIGKYNIKQANAFYTIGIYVYENDMGINDYKIYKTTNFIIANNGKANIICKDPYLNGHYLAYKYGYLITNYDILVNNNHYDGSKLKIGDVIEYLGIKIMYYGDFIYINSFNVINKLKPYDSYNAIVRYRNNDVIDNYYLPKDIEELEVESIKEYTEIRKPNSMDFIKSLLPNIIMCISMGFMALLNYYNNPSNRNILSYIVMPVSMFITSAFIPAIFILIDNIKYRKQERKNKEDYLSYLDEYQSKLKNEINEYIDSLNSRFFSLLNAYNMMFYANKKSDEYLKLSIGKITTSKKIEYKKTKDVDINSRLQAIEDNLSNIDECPLYLDLKENNIATIVSKRNDKYKIFYKYLLEASYKHHFNDIYIGVYSRDSNIFNNIYNLPHLFVNNKRMTLTTLDELRILDQIKIDKPLILFMYEKADYSFSNENIRQLYFSIDANDILKDSDVIIEYINNKGYVYNPNRIEFKYIEEDVKFVDYFSYIGRYKSLSNSNHIYSFSKTFKDDIGYYYNNNDHTLNATFAYHDNELISLNMHESKQGPHGLIGGSTGSGKSEFIVSLLLSLCIRYSPEYLNIVIIDYKGGGIKESLTNNNITIPHIVASVSNLENNALERLIISLKNDCKYRQEQFKKLSNKVNISIMNIDDYIQNNNNNNLPNIPHELIVVDEFAELKKENPELIKELISLSRIGRSLGLHLILATQKPAGVIDDEIWSNSRFKIALKVFDEKDSMDIIKRKDAAYLKNPGQFISLVDGSVAEGQCMYSKVDIYGNDPYRVSMLNNQLDVTYTYRKQEKSLTSEASYYINKINKYCSDKGYIVNELKYLPPKAIDRKDLNSKDYVFGQIDDYINGNVFDLTYSINDSLLVYSSRKDEINSILNTLNENKRNTIVISNTIYEGSYISDSINYDASEDIEYLFSHLFANKNNDLTLVIDDINCFLTYDERYLDVLCKLVKRKDNLNVSFVLICRNPQLSIKLINLFTNKLMININDYSDLSFFYGMRTHYKGNSFCFKSEPICFVPINTEEYNCENRSIPQLIKRIPDIIKAETASEKYLIGYNIKTKEKIYIDDCIDIYSHTQEYLDLYLTYPKVNTNVYNYSIKNNNENILWLGPGIFDQRLFITGFKNDLKEDEGLLIYKNKKIVIRRINNV